MRSNGIAHFTETQWRKVMCALELRRLLEMGTDATKPIATTLAGQFYWFSGR